MLVEASDQGIPSKTGTTTLTVNVFRDTRVPEFIGRKDKTIGVNFVPELEPVTQILADDPDLRDGVSTFLEIIKQML